MDGREFLVATRKGTTASPRFLPCNASFSADRTTIGPRLTSV